MFVGAAQLALAQERSSQPFTPASLRSAAEYLKDLNGHAMLVYHRDQLTFEEYFNGWSADQPHRLASGTKSFSGAMLAAAVEDGLRRSTRKSSIRLPNGKTIRASPKLRFATCCR
jgi:CubicO group peptidase (beta-lactamase class C family)